MDQKGAELKQYAVDMVNLKCFPKHLLPPCGPFPRIKNNPSFYISLDKT